MKRLDSKIEDEAAVEMAVNDDSEGFIDELPMDFIGVKRSREGDDDSVDSQPPQKRAKPESQNQESLIPMGLGAKKGK